MLMEGKTKGGMRPYDNNNVPRPNDPPPPTCGTQPTDVQQLKAEIAALISKFSVPKGVKIVPPSLEYLINELRQLSAV